MKHGNFPQGTSFRPLMTQGPFNAQVASVVSRLSQPANESIQVSP